MDTQHEDQTHQTHRAHQTGQTHQVERPGEVARATTARAEGAGSLGAGGAQGGGAEHAGIHERLRRLGHLMRRRRAEAHHVHGPLADTTRGRGRVLAALRMQSPVPTRELAFVLDIRQQSLNELLKKLEADGLVERTPSQEDRRVMLVSLTEAGRRAPLGPEGEDPLSVLSPEEAQTLAAVLDKLIASLEAQLGLDSEEEDETWRQARRRMGEERVETMMRMREHGFGSWGEPGPGRGHRGGHEDGHGDGHGNGRRGGHGDGHGRGHRGGHGDGHGRGHRGGHGNGHRGGHGGGRGGRGRLDLPDGQAPDRESRAYRGRRPDRRW